MNVIDFYVEENVESKPLTYFFNDPEYLQLFSAYQICSFNLKSEVGKILARINFTIIGNTAISLKTAPFGFIETGINSVKLLSDFILRVEKHLGDIGIKFITLKCWPECYNQEDTRLLSEILFNAGYSIEYSESNYYLEVLEKSVITIFKKPEKKRLRKCINAGFEFIQLLNPEPKQVYNLLSSFRDQKIIPLNISEEVLEKSLTSFQDKYFVFVVKDKGRIIGISVCVEVNNDILYHFVLAADIEYNTYSPSVMLYAGIYSFCQGSNYKIFDFGIASIQGIKQDGLCKFKENLGGIFCEKPVFTKVV